MRPRGAPTAMVRPDAHLAELRRRRTELEAKNRELATAVARSGKPPTAAERAVMQENIREIGSIKATLRAFGCLYQ